MAPSTWSDDPAFVDALMAALTMNPIIQPVTTSDLFTTLPTATCRTGCRLTDPVAPRFRWGPSATSASGDEFASAAPTATSVIPQLGIWSWRASPSRSGPARVQVLHNAGAAVNAQLASWLGGRPAVTLTSQRGTVQVTIISYAPYPVTTALTLTSDKLLFPGGTTQWTSKAITLIGRGPHQHHPGHRASPRLGHLRRSPSSCAPRPAGSPCPVAR